MALFLPGVLSDVMSWTTWTDVLSATERQELLAELPFDNDADKQRAVKELFDASVRHASDADASIARLNNTFATDVQGGASSTRSASASSRSAATRKRTRTGTAAGTRAGTGTGTGGHPLPSVGRVPFSSPLRQVERLYAVGALDPVVRPMYLETRLHRKFEFEMHLDEYFRCTLASVVMKVCRAKEILYI